MKAFLRFISRNRLYTVIEVAGMAIALAFIIFIGTYVISESNYDTFVGEDIYVGTDGDFYMQSGTIKADLEGRFPQITAISRMIGLDALGGVEKTVKTGETEMNIKGMAVDSNFLSLIPIAMSSGGGSEVLAALNSAIVSESFANTWFPEGNAIGSTLDITVNGEKSSLTVTGIFREPQRTVLPQSDMIFRLELMERLFPDITRNGNGTTVTLYRLAPGTDPELLSKNILEILNETDALYLSGLCTDYRLVAFKDIHHGVAEYRYPFENIVSRETLNLFAAVGVLLLVFALLNYISLSSALVSFRAKEMATRQLVGSTRTGIVLRSILESFLLTLTAFILGFILAEALSPVFGDLIGKQYSPLDLLDWGTGALWAGIIILLSILAGTIPALMLSRYKPISIVRGEFGKTSKMVLGKIFLTLQDVTAIGALALAFAMFLQLRHMIEKPMGYTMDSLVDVTVTNSTDPDDFLTDRLRTMPFVSDLGWIQSCPASSVRASMGSSKDGERINFTVMSSDTTALRLLGTGIISRNAECTPYSYFLTERTARAMDVAPGESFLELDNGTMYVCGIIGDLWLGNANSTDNPLLVWQVFPSDLRDGMGNIRSLVVKVNGDTDQAVKAIKEFYAKEAPELTVRVDSYHNIYRSTYTAQDNNLRLISLLALLTVILTVMAMVAMSTYYYRQHMKNTAIRKILGCSRESIYWNTVRSFLAAVLLAAVIAVPCVYYITGRWLQGYSYRIDNYWWIYVAAIAAVMAIATVSITYRAVQLVNTRPATALRKD